MYFGEEVSWTFFNLFPCLGGIFTSVHTRTAFEDEAGTDVDPKAGLKINKSLIPLSSYKQ